MDKFTFVIPTLFGVEGVTIKELERMGMANPRGETGRVLCEGTLADIPRLNLRLRTGERVLVRLASFRADSFDALFKGTESTPWEDFIPADGAFPVKGFSLNSQLHSVPDCQKIIKKAAAVRLGRVYGTQQLPESGALYQIQFSILKDEVNLMLDTSGPGLHKRGYRAIGVEAPLRETLAAAMVILSGYRGRDPFLDPFCGSGTICIEAALIAKNRAPGLNRTFPSQKWACLPAKYWMEAADEAMDLEYDGKYEIHGSDIDPAAVGLARQNAAKADVEDCVTFSRADARKLVRTEPYGRVVCNPPYGQRLMELKEVAALYKDFSRTVKGLPAGWQTSVISSFDGFEKAFGMRADKRRKLYNGMLLCYLYQYGKKAPKGKK